MSEAIKAPFQAIRPETAIAAAQNGATCWSRAFSHLTEGFMAAAKAQAALASEVFKVEQHDWLKPVTSENVSEVTHEWLVSHRARQEALLRGFRQINDDLTACLFAVADDLADGLNFGSGKAEPLSATKRENVKATGPTEKRAA